MKKMLNTLYVTSEDLYLSCSNENVVVNRGSEVTARLPLINLEGIVTFSYAGATPALMGECARRGIQLSFMTPSGRFLARVSGMTQGNVLLRREQYRIADDEARSLNIARSMLTGKVFNGRWVLERALRDHALRIAPSVKAASERLQGLIGSIRTAEAEDTLRGLEGEAASVYFGVFDELILSQKLDFSFDGRNRRTMSMPCCRLRTRCFQMTVRRRLRPWGWMPMWAFFTVTAPGENRWRSILRRSCAPPLPIGWC